MPFITLHYSKHMWILPFIILKYTILLPNLILVYIKHKYGLDIHRLSLFAYVQVHDAFCISLQGFNGAPSLDVMLLKQQFFSSSGINHTHDQTFQYAYRRYHPLLQFLPLKLAEWLAKNLSEELNLPNSGDELSSADLNNILTRCLASNWKGDNLHTFHCAEFESDLYQGVMRVLFSFQHGQASLY